MEKIILGIIIGLAIMYLISPYLTKTTGEVTECPRYPIIECPKCPENLKLGTKFSTSWQILFCEATVDYAIVNHGVAKANGVNLYLQVENPALAKIRDSKTINIGDIGVNEEPRFGSEKLKYNCDDDIVKITATVTDSSGRSDIKIFEKRKQ